MVDLITHSIDAVTSAMGRSPVGAFAQNVGWAVPAVQSIHILAVAAATICVVAIHFRILGLFETELDLATVGKRFFGPILVAVAVLAVTGLILISGEPTRAPFRVIFWQKMLMALLSVGVTAGVVVAAKRQAAGAGRQAVLPPPYKIAAVAALALWVGVIVAGRWIGYADGWPGSPL